MANVDNPQDATGVPDAPRGKTRWEAHGPTILRILIGDGRSHDFLTGLSVIIAGSRLDTKSLSSHILDVILNREGIENIQLIPRADVVPPGEFARMQISASVSRILLAHLLRSCVNVAFRQQNVEFMDQAIEFAKAFGITLEFTAKA